MQERIVIAARQLEVSYGGTQALRGVSLDIPARQVTALIGPSGCGKSTFLRSINRMNDLTEGVRVRGSLTFHSREIYGPDWDVTDLRRRVGMVFQRPNPFPMSIYDNVAYGPRIHGVRGRGRLEGIVEASLRAAGLWEEVRDRLKKSALDLSGGQQQRLCIARALAVEPEVLLMDEVTSALDPVSTARVEELICDLRERCTIVLVTHSLPQARRVADRTAFFLSGELVEQGETARLFTLPRDPRTRDYVAGRFG